MRSIKFYSLIIWIPFAILLLSLPALGQEEKWQTLFNGKDLNGWRELNGDHIWEVRDGMIVGSTVPGEPNGFLCTDLEFWDFVLELEVSVDTLMNNSGIQFRSLSYPAYKDGRVHGYQMEVDPKPQQWSGAIYEEGADRGWIYPPEKLSSATKNAFKRDDRSGYQWNRYRIECVGSVIRTWVNGVPAAHLIDDRYLKGFIGLQLHANNENDPQGSFSIRFRNIRIQSGDLDLTPLDDVTVVDLLEQNEAVEEEDIAKPLRVKHDPTVGAIKVFQENKEQAILTQMALPDERPYLHPILAPDGKGIMTEYRPAHHPHQTGIYWGLKKVNGRDYFMNWNSDYWRKVSANVLENEGERVQWQTVYEMLDEQGNILMIETQNWSMQQLGEKYVLDLEWQGKANKDVVIGQFYVGGLFVRMPWDDETVGEIVNSSGQHGMELEGQRAVWSDIGIRLEGRDDPAHIAIFDHPDNKSFPTPWRVDNEMGIGPSRQILGDWKIEKGKTEVIRYRLLLYTGTLDKAQLTRTWKDFFREY